MYTYVVLEKAAAMKEIQYELQKKPVAPNTGVVSPRASIPTKTDMLSPFTAQFSKLQAAFEDYKSILKLEERAVFEVANGKSGSDVVQREQQTLASMKDLEQHLRTRADELRNLGLQAMKKREESGVDPKHQADGGCSVQ
jgi:hypothetical protein